MGEFIANEDMEVGFTNNVGPPDLVYSGDQPIDPIKIVPVKSTKAKANDKFICSQNITITWAGPPTQCPHTSATYNFVSGAGTVIAAAIKCKTENQFVLRETDTGLCAGSWTLKVSPFTPQVCACDVEITNAGQTKVKAS